ncbi:MAG: ACP S-malonyltransferase [Planctomycetales bacterium]|nr:ACP S-malonyltransferase [Planctomycetales bacterium]
MSNLKDRFSNAAFALRGYNVTNMGKSPQLLAHPKFGPIVESYLREASEICSEVIQQPVDLVTRVKEAREPTLDEYAEAITLIVSMEQAQLRLLDEFFGIKFQDARVACGFSLGEISALVAAGVYTMKDALQIPLAMASDGVQLAQDVELGVLFSRADSLPLHEIRRAFIDINQQGDGIIGISTHLAPNSVLVLGSGSTMDAFRARVKQIAPKGLHLRKNDNRWPPLHTPLMWAKNIPNRAAQMLLTLPGGITAPKPPILSLVTGTTCYSDLNSREIIAQWIDHPQRLWDVVCELLSMGVTKIIHVGPEPNIVPATFERLAQNVMSQSKESRRVRALSAAAQRRWLQVVLPKKAMLLRAPHVQHVILEDWLLEQKVN